MANSWITKVAPTVNLSGLKDPLLARILQDVYRDLASVINNLSTKSDSVYITALTGDVIAMGPGSVSATIQPGVVTLSKMAPLSGRCVIGNATAGAATPAALSITSLKSLLTITEADVANLVGDLAGKVPTSTTVNGYALSSNVVISASDITTGALPHAQLPALTSFDVGLPNVTNDAQIKASIGITKGDLITFSGSTTPARLAAGANAGNLRTDGSGNWAIDTDAGVVAQNGGAITTNRGLFVATGTNPFTLPATAVNQAIDVKQSPGATNIITVTPPATSYIEKPGVGYCNIGHSLISGGSKSDFLPTRGLDGTHVIVPPYAGGAWSCYGAIDAPANYNAPNTQFNIGSAAGLTYLATQFTASQSYTLTSFFAQLKKVGSPIGNVSAYLYSDSANTPGALLATSSTTLAASTLGAAFTPQSFTFAGYSIVSATKYWVVLFSSVIDASNHPAWGTNSSDTGTGTFKAQTPPTWTLINTGIAGYQTWGTY
jgi:hypothetical protein